MSSSPPPAPGRLLRRLAAACAIAALLVLGVWAALGAAIVTQYEVAAEVVEQDEFGDEVTRTVMMPQFRFGLLPDRGYDGALPLAGGFGGLAFVFFFLSRRQRP
jgi:hypothetical protein